MKRPISFALAHVALVAGSLVAIDCGGSGDAVTGQPAGDDAGVSGDDGAGGGSADTGANADSGCRTDADCLPGLPPTLPANCAAAVCDKVELKCRYVAKDKDNDGHPASQCSAGGGAVIEIGDDCNDADPDINPKAWDGPMGDGKPDRCNDGIDQDCSGADSDGRLENGGTCTCTPGDIQSCNQDSGGKPVVFPLGKPIGACRSGSMTCLDTGKWGPCTDAVGPATEVCNEIDDDCDDDIDDSAVGTATWFRDADGDGHGDKNTAAIVKCFAPDDTWKKDIPNDDCNDVDDQTYPTAWDGPLAAKTDAGITSAGLKADFYNCTSVANCLANPFGGSALVSRTDYAVNYNIFLGSPAVGMAVDNWAARWSGSVTAGAAGVYTFYTSTDDGVRLTVNGVRIIDHWVAAGVASYSGTATLTAGQSVPIVFDVFDGASAALAVLEWQGPGITRQVLRTVSSPQEGDRPNRCGDGKDNDCNNSVDDGQVHDGALLVTCTSCPVGTARVCGPANVGVCHQGTQFCQPTGTWTATCAGEVTPTTDVCNTLDDDCDGLKDNPPTKCACVNAATQSCGACNDGTQTCAAGAWGTCIGASVKQDYCRDQDKDGYCTLECTAACAAPDATWRLKSGCVAYNDCNDNNDKMRPGLAEVCDTLDNNCNNQIDENLLGAACIAKAGTPCQASGNYTCVNGNITTVCNAVAKPPAPETCDGIDNDCDGKIDDGQYLADANYVGAACFVCVTPLMGQNYMAGPPLEGDAEFMTNGPGVYTRLKFALGTGNYAGRLQVDNCTLMRETAGDHSTGVDCSTNYTIPKYNGQTVVATQIITADVLGTFTYGAYSQMQLLYTDTDASTGAFDDTGSLTIPAATSTLKTLGYACRAQMTGADIINSGSPAGCTFSTTGCVTVRFAAP